MKQLTESMQNLNNLEKVWNDVKRIAAGVITTAQVRQTIIKGTKRKVEADERS